MRGCTKDTKNGSDGWYSFQGLSVNQRTVTKKNKNAMGENLKYKNKWCTHWKLFSFFAESYEHFRSFWYHKSMNAESAIKKLQIIAKEKEVQMSERKRR